MSIQIYFYIAVISFLIAISIISHRIIFNWQNRKLQKELLQQERKIGGKKIFLKNIQQATKIKNKPTKEKMYINYPKLRDLLKKAELAISRDSWKDAERILIGALAIHDNSTETLSDLGLVYLKQNSSSKAELIYQKLTELEPKNSLHYSNLGLAFFNQRKYKEAESAYQKAVTLDNLNPVRYANLGRIYYQARNYTAAIDAFQKACELKKRDTDYLFLLGDTYRQANYKKEASDVYNKILDFEPYNEEAKEKLNNL